MDLPDLYADLKRYWGYDSFRPMQERIIQSLMGGSDVAVVMPTGGGKSLCYQLPALAMGQTVVVISPLIALMQDQVAQLGDMGIPSAVLNSSQASDEQRTVMRAAQQGAYRLLYLSPERLARPDTVAWLHKVPLAFFAIDEARIFRISPSRPSQRAPPSACGRTFWTNCVCASRTNTSPASTARTCDTWPTSATASLTRGCW
jgi:superfamily II DNA helicase RecQ